MENCLIVKLKSVVNNDNLVPLGGIALIGGKGETTARWWYFNTNLAGESSIKILGGHILVDDSPVTSFLSGPRDGGGFRVYNDDPTKEMKIIISNADKYYRLGGVDVANPLSQFSMLAPQLVKLVAETRSTGDISDVGNMINLELLDVGYRRATGVRGSVNSLAELQISNGRDYTTNPYLEVRGQSSMSYYNGSQTIQLTNNQKIFIVFKSGGYELHDNSIDGTLLYDSLL